MRDIEGFRSDLTSWFQKNQRNLPWRKDRNAYKTWVSELMLQQTQVATVSKYFKRWMDALPNIEAVAKASDERLMHLWQGLGYYRRVRNLKKGALYIMEHHQGEIPQTVDELLKIPGIGQYSAGAISSLGFNIPAPIVDGNILRLFSRLYSLHSPINEKHTHDTIFKMQSKLVPKKNPGEFNEALMELGAMVCSVTSPYCYRCCVQKHCQAYKEDKVSLLPKKSVKKVVTKLSSCAVVIKKDDKVYLQKRPEGQRMGGLWEFPEWKSDEGVIWKQNQARKALALELLQSDTTMAPLAEFKRHYTRFSETMHVFATEMTELPDSIPSDWDHKWVEIDRLKDYALTSAHNRIRNIVINPETAD